MSQQPENAISNQNMVDEQQQQIVIQDDKSQFSENFQSDQQNPVEINDQDIKKIQSLPKVTNPISPYSIFMRDWKQKHPQEKMIMSMIGQIWKELDANEKQIYEKKYIQEKEKYDNYVAEMLTIDPNFGKRNNLSKQFFFPLHRVKAIMKQDDYFTTSTQNVSAMTRIAQYFGQFLLDEVKKSTEGKKRIDLNDLFEAINTNQNNLWFLNCLIDEHNLQSESATKAHHTQIKKKQVDMANEDNLEKQKKKAEKKAQRQTQKNLQKQSNRKSKHTIAQGQLKLTDMF